MSRNILFVADLDGDISEGFSYTMDLARMIGKGVEVLLLRRKTLGESFDAVMSAITFAEAGEPETAREVPGTLKQSEEGLKLMETQFKLSGMKPTIQTSTDEAPDAIKAVLSKNKGIDMVILSPSITTAGGKTVRTLAKLLKSSSIPIVTITNNGRSAAAAKEAAA